MVTTTKILLDDTTVIQANQFPIKSVKLFRSDSAEITRTFPLPFIRAQDDPQVVEILNLPAGISSVNVSVTSLSGNVTILDHYQASLAKSRHSNKPNVSNPTLRELETERQRLENEKRHREQSFTFLTTYMDSLAQCKSQSQTETAQMVSFFDEFVEIGVTRSAVIADLDGKLADVNNRINEETGRLSKLEYELPVKVVVVFSCGGQAPVEAAELTLTYAVKHVSWKPMYDLHVAMTGNTPSPTVTLDFRCSVTQWTGENWENVKLALTTAEQVSQLIKVPEPKRVDVRLRASYIFQVPQQTPAQAQIRPQALARMVPSSHSNRHVPTSDLNQIQNRPMQSQAVIHHQIASARRCRSMRAPRTTTDMENNVLLPPQEPANREIAENPLNVAEGETYDSEEGKSQTVSQLISHGSRDPVTHIANGSIFIPSDHAEHHALVASFPLRAEFMRVAVPGNDTRVYYTCEVKNTSEHVLFPGTVKTYLNDRHVSSTGIHSTDLPQTLECCLAVDTDVKTIHNRAPDALPSVGAFTGKTVTTYTSAIVVQNTHAEPVRGVVVRSALPLPADPRITVVLKEPAGLAEIEEGSTTVREGCLARWSTTGGRKGRQAGLFEWVCDVEPGTEVLKAVWEVCAPQDLKLFEQVHD